LTGALFTAPSHFTQRKCALRNQSLTIAATFLTQQCRGGCSGPFTIDRAWPASTCGRDDSWDEEIQRDIQRDWNIAVSRGPEAILKFLGLSTDANTKES